VTSWRPFLLALWVLAAAPAWAESKDPPCMGLEVKSGTLSIDPGEQPGADAIIVARGKNCPEATWSVTRRFWPLDRIDLLRLLIECTALLGIGMTVRRIAPHLRLSKSKQPSSLPPPDDLPELEVPSQTPPGDDATSSSAPPPEPSPEEPSEDVSFTTFFKLYPKALEYPAERPELVRRFKLVSLRASRFAIPQRSSENLDGPQDADLWGFREGPLLVVVPGPALYRRRTRLSYEDCAEARFFLSEYFDIVPSDSFAVKTPALLTAASPVAEYRCRQKGLIHWS